MCDATDISLDPVGGTYDHGVLPLPASLLERPQTPAPDGTRTLRRTISYASIETVHPSHGKGVRRRIKEIAESMKNKTTRKKGRDPAKRDVPRHNTTRARASDPKESTAGQGTTDGRRATRPLQDASRQSTSEAEQVLAITDSGVPSEQDTPSTVLHCASDRLVDESPPKDDDQSRQDGLFFNWDLEPSAPVEIGQATIFRVRQLAPVDVADVQLDIRPADPDVTIWDGLRADHHLFKCRLFLRCKTHPYDSVSLPHIPRFEMNCNTHPVSGTRYARPPVLQTAYQGATPGILPNSNGLPSVRPAAGIHVDQYWQRVLEDDGTWGWYRDAYVPLSPRLFDKADYRQFRLVGRVWFGESCVEGESTFGVSLLLRQVEMN